MIRKILFFLIIFLSACTFDKSQLYDDEDCDYSNCNTQEPFVAKISIKFSRPAECPYPEIYVMIENYDTRKIADTIKTDSISGFVAGYSAGLNRKYIIAARYIIGDDTIIALDGKYVYKDFYYECDSVCWTVKNTSFNVKLKNNNF